MKEPRLQFIVLPGVSETFRGPVIRSQGNTCVCILAPGTWYAHVYYCKSQFVVGSSAGCCRTLLCRVLDSSGLACSVLRPLSFSAALRLDSPGLKVYCLEATVRTYVFSPTGVLSTTTWYYGCLHLLCHCCILQYLYCIVPYTCYGIE